MLLADDHEAVADQLRRVLETECEVVGVVRNGAALVAAYEKLRPQVVVTDIVMPGMDGLAAARAILTHHPAARIIFVSVRDEQGVVQRALDLGASGYVVKGDAGEELLPTVHAVMAGRIHVSSRARLG